MLPLIINSLVGTLNLPAIVLLGSASSAHVITKLSSFRVFRTIVFLFYSGSTLLCVLPFQSACSRNYKVQTHSEFAQWQTVTGHRFPLEAASGDCGAGPLIFLLFAIGSSMWATLFILKTSCAGTDVITSLMSALGSTSDLCFKRCNRWIE